MSRLIVAAVSVIFWLASASGQGFPLPNTVLGHTQGNSTAPILLTVFFDHQCPDSQASWPVIKQVIAYYGNQLFTRVNIFPLPYHHTAFTAAQAGLVIASAAGEATWFQWLDLYFSQQASFSNTNTTTMSADQIIQAMSKLAVQLGVDAATFASGMQYGNDFDEATRIGWKYGCSRGVTGTPAFLVNDIMITDPNAMDYTLEDWQNVISPLLPQASRRPSKF
eukprot:TRINITY_DN6708_c0_g1_i1.p2 TRINITY_DN6708_c0_g1~~TRINITY_DN6708_c0_g1_i1.p2  ORF type:complete len:222 (+),score=74.45 TRINITY_DN6708_c0_g1_i1:83-748(+)